jgi:acyl-CoA reductase-like NAD-dependent aldehyde dehydrogenase
VFVEGDPEPVAKAIADRLSVIPSVAPECDDAVLPAFAVDRAMSLETHLRSKLDGARLLAVGPLTEELPGGGAVLRPAVLLLDRPDSSRAGVELPFPCVWVAPWSPDDGIAPLENSLVLTAFTPDDRLLDRLIDSPSIGNVHIGDHPTHVMDPDLPHDGYLAEFLMRGKTVIGR